MPTIRIGTPTMHGSAAIGLTQTAAPTTRSAVTHAIDVSGIANRIVRASASTSAVVRETRSPIPARSTVESGRASTRRMKSSRSSANIRSERTNEARRAKNVRIVCATRKTARIATTRSISAVSMLVWSPCTSEPRSGGPTRPVAAARACRTRTPIIARRWRPARSAAWRRISGGLAIGRSLLMPAAPPGDRLQPSPPRGLGRPGHAHRSTSTTGDRVTRPLGHDIAIRGSSGAARGASPSPARARRR